MTPTSCVWQVGSLGVSTPTPRPGATPGRLVEKPDGRNDYGEQDDHHDETQQRVTPDLALFRAVHLVPIRFRSDLQEMPPTFALLAAVPHAMKRTPRPIPYGNTVLDPAAHELMAGHHGKRCRG